MTHKNKPNIAQRCRVLQSIGKQFNYNINALLCWSKCWFYCSCAFASVILKWDTV